MGAAPAELGRPRSPAARERCSRGRRLGRGPAGAGARGGAPGPDHRSGRADVAAGGVARGGGAGAGPRRGGGPGEGGRAARAALGRRRDGSCRGAAGTACRVDAPATARGRCALGDEGRSGRGRAGLGEGSDRACWVATPERCSRRGRSTASTRRGWYASCGWCLAFPNEPRSARRGPAPGGADRGAVVGDGASGSATAMRHGGVPRPCDGWPQSGCAFHVKRGAVRAVAVAGRLGEFGVWGRGGPHGVVGCGCQVLGGSHASCERGRGDRGPW